MEKHRGNRRSLSRQGRQEMSGWFAVKRGITAHPVFKGRPERLAIWLWLLDNTCWADTVHDINGKMVTIPRGSVAASERRIAEEAGVGRQVVRTFLALLEDQHMINPSLTHGRRIITLCNWEKYQAPQPKPNQATNPELTQGQPIKEQDNNSVSKDTASVDPEKIMFDSGRAMLIATGKSKAAAGALLGKWKAEYGTEAVIAALGRAHREGATDPVSFIVARLKRSPRDKGDDDQFGAFGRIRSVG
jgi:hypothetical protein